MGTNCHAVVGLESGAGAAQVHAKVRIAATTCHQGNLSMPDAAEAERDLDQPHVAQERTSLPPRKIAL
jgi:hypothetical protein